MFDGTSFLQFIGLQRTVLSFTEIEIIIKPTRQDGLIFYNGYSKDRTGDFVSLALKNGYVEYRFDLGTGPAYLRFRYNGFNCREALQPIGFCMFSFERINQSDQMSFRVTF